MSPPGTKLAFLMSACLVAIGGKADLARMSRNRREWPIPSFIRPDCWLYRTKQNSPNERPWNTFAISNDLFHLNVCRLDDRRPARDLALDQCEKRLRAPI